MDYRKMSRDELCQLRFEALKRDNANAAREIDDFINFYDKTVKVVKGRKVPIGTTGTVFWIQRTNYSKYGDPWGIYSTTKIGIKTDSGEVHFTALNNVAKI